MIRLCIAQLRLLCTFGTSSICSAENFHRKALYFFWFGTVGCRCGCFLKVSTAAVEARRPMHVSQKRRDELCVWVWVFVAHHRNRSRMRKNYNNNSASERSKKKKIYCHKSHAHQFCTYSGRYMYDEMGITTRTNQRAFFFCSRWFVRSFTYRHRFGSSLCLTPVEFSKWKHKSARSKIWSTTEEKKKYCITFARWLKFFFSFVSIFVILAVGLFYVALNCFSFLLVVAGIFFLFFIFVSVFAAAASRWLETFRWMCKISTIAHTRASTFALSVFNRHTRRLIRNVQRVKCEL